MERTIESKETENRSLTDRELDDVSGGTAKVRAVQRQLEEYRSAVSANNVAA
jgi:hypothetical protein